MLKILRQVAFILIGLLPLSHEICAKLPEINAEGVTSKIQEIMKAHATHKELAPIVVKRALVNYLEELDPTKTYFIESDIIQWLEPCESLITLVLLNTRESNFAVFEQMNMAMEKAIERRRSWEKQINQEQLPTHVKAEEFKDMKWAKNENDLLDRLKRIRSLQAETASKLNEELKEKSLQRITKRQDKYEEDILNNDPSHRRRFTYSHVLKAFASALDTHTAYFTPDEATQFMINVQQRLFGIGAQLRDDLNGFTVVKIIEGGPAGEGKELKVKDRIIAVNAEPVVGMDIEDAVELIRGEKNSPVTLTVIRETEVEPKKEEKVDVVVKRGEVVLKETRYESSYEPFGDGSIGYIRLYSFYQDPETSSADDLGKAIAELKKDHKIKGLILDLRFNSGGMLSQAVSVTGLFITKGVVVSIKDDSGNIQHLRDLDGKMAWDGPLIVLVNRASASASEIVAQTLQDYGRAIIVGDDHTYGKGSFQTFTLNSTNDSLVNPSGEYKVTRGRYYTVSGKTPQLEGVISDIVLPGPLSETEIGEKFAKYPLENDRIKDNFDDDLADVPFSQRAKIKMLYKFDLQQRLDTYTANLDALKKNASWRLEHNKNYQNFLKELKKKDKEIFEDSEADTFGQNDLQLTEAYNIMKDLIMLMQAKPPA